jgi:N6-L-threonylcarbamoyladenine synthase
VSIGDTDLLLAIETSCDDTCAAVLRGDRTVLSNIVARQDVHGEYLGVVPELASREHLRLLLPTVRRALEKAETNLEGISAIAVTHGPGLIGCLLVGLAGAKGFAMSRGIPFVGVNHIEGHLSAILAERDWDPPFVGLVASGGHTELVYVAEWGRYELLGATRDDAAGEAFDKVAKLIGLGFPGGPLVDRLATDGDPGAFPYPRAWLDKDGPLDFSFSGLKTAVKYHLEREGIPDAEPERARFLGNVCASFQAAVVDVLVGKIERACERTGTRRILLSGGVACNRALRRAATDLADRIGGEAAYPSPRLCADNAVMIGVAGLARLRAGESDGLALPAVANLDDLAFGTRWVQPR